VVDWRVYGAVVRFRMTPEMSEERIFAILAAAVFLLH
jgi:hypothetical protein